jgi:hypothetical protein
MSSPRWSMIALPAALGVLLLSACGTTAPSPSPSPSAMSGVQGKVMWAGGPVVSTEGATPTAQQGTLPRVTVVVHRGDLGGAVVAKVKTDALGRFLVELAPGTYTLVAEVPGARPEKVAVEAGRLAQTTLWDSVP